MVQTQHNGLEKTSTTHDNPILIATAANSVFIKLWLDVKLSTINHYFAFVVN